jgi:hypothetical protein
MAAQPITYLAIKYPAPICERCGLAMLTVTTVHHRLKSDPLKVICYRCQRCGGTLGDRYQRRENPHAKDV